MDIFMHMSCICHAGKEWCNQFFNEPSPAFTSHNRFSWMAKDENWGLLCHSCCLDLSPFSLDAGLDDQNIYCITYVHIMRILQIDYIILHVQYIIQQIDSIDIICTYIIKPFSMIRYRSFIWRLVFQILKINQCVSNIEFFFEMILQNYVSW